MKVWKKRNLLHTTCIGENKTAHCGKWSLTPGLENTSQTLKIPTSNTLGLQYSKWKRPFSWVIHAMWFSCHCLVWTPVSVSYGEWPQLSSKWHLFWPRLSCFEMDPGLAVGLELCVRHSIKSGLAHCLLARC